MSDKDVLFCENNLFLQYVRGEISLTMWENAIKELYRRRHNKK